MCSSLKAPLKKTKTSIFYSFVKLPHQKDKSGVVIVISFHAIFQLKFNRTFIVSNMKLMKWLQMQILGGKNSSTFMSLDLLARTQRKYFYSSVQVYLRNEE